MPEQLTIPTADYRPQHGDILREPCVYCGAAAGQLCMTPQGEATNFHRRRRHDVRYLPVASE